MRRNTNHPLIYEYLKKYQSNPQSRVFAPLAEAYRKAGLLEEAIEIAREGLMVHPQFIGGRVALARALFDKKQYANVIKELESVIRDAPDNLIAQKLMGDSYLIQGKVREALKSFKMLLYFNPQDEETAQLIQELESKAYKDQTLVLTPEEPAKSVKPPPPPIHRLPLRAVASPSGLDAQTWTQSRNVWAWKIKILQELLQRVERYRWQNRASSLE